MSRDKLRTPEVKVREFQEKLHQSAKANKRRRFHQLYDKVWAPWFLSVAWQRVRANKGAPGPDGITIEQIEAQGVDKFLSELSEDLRKRTYRTGPTRRKYIPKPNGKLRPLGIPNIRDRTAQASVLLVLEPIFEADLPDTAYGFRPGRDAHQALDAVGQHLLAGYTDVVDADLAAYFDTIPHANLLKLVAERVVDRGVLALIKQWLESPIIEPDAPPGSPGKSSPKGTPQGGVISPLLANVYHACIPRVWEQWESTKRLGGRFVSYADDFVIMLRPGRGRAAMHQLKQVCQRLSLELSVEKTRTVDGRSESFKFLGFDIRKKRYPSGKAGPCVSPTAKAEQHLRDSVREILNRRMCWRPVPQVVQETNATVRGWVQYFRYGQCYGTMRRAKFFTEQRLRKWLTRRRQKRGQGYTEYPTACLYRTFGLYAVPMTRLYATPKASG
jgi:group II intron reverse transcriptase/maturase